MLYGLPVSSRRLIAGGTTLFFVLAGASVAWAFGAFSPRVDYPVGSTPTALVVADFDGSGSPDIAVTDTGSNTVSVLLGNGDGTFRPAASYPVGQAPGAIRANVVDNGPDLDLVVANFGSDTVKVLLGDGDGTFSPRKAVHRRWFACRAGGRALQRGQAGRCGGDQRRRSPGDGAPCIQERQAQDPRTPSAWAGARSRSSPVTSIATGAATWPWPTPPMTIWPCCSATAEGNFDKAVKVPVGDGPAAVIVGRINADKRTDLATANSLGNSVSVLLSKGGKRKFRAATTHPVGSNPLALADEDVTGDGLRDLAVANADDDTVSILPAAGPASSTLPAGDLPAAIGRGDFNGDGGIDLAVANSGDADVSVFLNQP